MATGAEKVAAAAGVLGGLSVAWACGLGGPAVKPLPKKGLKLYYWPATGLAEVVRLALSAAGVEFEDKVFAKLTDTPVYGGKTWYEKYAETTAYQEFCASCRAKGGNATTNIPMLEFPDGTCYTQSNAVYNLVARRTGLYPIDDIEQAFIVDNIVAHVSDAKNLPYSALSGALTKQDLLNDGIPKHIGNLERLLGDKEFYLGSTFSLADICVYDCVVNFYETSVPEMFAGGKYPRIQALCKRVAERPGIKEYLASDACAAIDRMTPL